MCIRDRYRELASFSQFGSDIDKETKARLDHGRILMEILKQGQYKPMDVIDQIIIIYAATQGYMEDVEIGDVENFQEGLLLYMRDHYPEVEAEIRKTGQFSEETEELLIEGIKKYKEV